MNWQTFCYVSILAVLILVNGIQLGKRFRILDVFQILIYFATLTWYSQLPDVNQAFLLWTSLLFLLSCILEAIALGKTQGSKFWGIVTLILSLIPIFLAILVLCAVI